MYITSERSQSEKSTYCMILATWSSWKGPATGIVKALVTLTLVACSPPGSSVHRILQQEYWSGLPFPSPGDLTDPGIKSTSPALQADFLLLNNWGSPFNSIIRATMFTEAYKGSQNMLHSFFLWRDNLEIRKTCCNLNKPVAFICFLGMIHSNKYILAHMCVYKWNISLSK